MAMDTPKINRFALLLISFLPFYAEGQSIADVIRFSYQEPGGTARYTATGGSMSAIGPDLSSVNSNPAGIALYRKSECSISPAFISTKTNARLITDKNGTALSENKLGLNMQNIGMVFTSQPVHDKWKQMNFAITLNHLNHFSNTTRFSGTSPGTLLQRFQEIANAGVGLDDFETGIASEAGALYDLNGDGKYDIDYQLAPKALLQRGQEIQQSGSSSELAFSLAANYNEKVSIGLTVGLPFLSYYKLSEYAETDPVKAPGGVPYFKDLNYREELSTTGSGANFKLGVIVKPQPNIRIGMAVHSPTFLNISDIYQNELEYNYYENANETGTFLGSKAVAEGSFEYRFKTPWRYFGNIGLVLGKKGFIGGEVEYVNYAANRFNYNGFEEAENESNIEITGRLTQALAIRMGGEAVIQNVYRLRAGLQLYTSPFNGDETSKTILSIGGGRRGDKYFFDVCYRYNQWNEVFFPYLTRNSPFQEVENALTKQSFIVTVGTKF
jgi:long-subunit fatty acid transport protein